MSFTWQHITFEDGRNPYICKTAEEFDRMKNKYNLEYVSGDLWFVKMYERISDWLEIQYRYITEDMKTYTNEEDYWQPGFEFEGGFHYLSNFVRVHDNPWGNMTAPDYIHGYDGTDWYNPLFIEIDDGGEAVRLYTRTR